MSREHQINSWRDLDYTICIDFSGEPSMNIRKTICIFIEAISHPHPGDIMPVNQVARMLLLVPFGMAAHADIHIGVVPPPLYYAPPPAYYRPPPPVYYGPDIVYGPGGWVPPDAVVPPPLYYAPPPAYYRPPPPVYYGPGIVYGEGGWNSDDDDD